MKTKKVSRSKYRNLIIVGNGFDRWQSIPSSYDAFREYYHNNVDRIICEDDMEKVKDENGDDIILTVVDIIYGKSFSRGRLPNEFFWNFESELANIDDQRIVKQFGRKDEDVKKLEKTINDAKNIMRKIFCDWIGTFSIENGSSGYTFPDNCYVINFNYTDTVERRFGVLPENNYYIHGNVSKPETIVFGHTSHPETAFEELREHHFIKGIDPENTLPRIRGLYAVEKLLFETDKHVADRIDDMCEKMYYRGVHIEDIENIYVLGHSFGEVDIEYFRFIDKVTRCGCDFNSLSAVECLDKNIPELLLSANSEYEKDLLFDVLFDLIKKNINYAFHRRERLFPDAPDLYPEYTKLDGQYGNYSKQEEMREIQAVRQRFLWEQANRTQEVLSRISSSSGLRDVPENCHSVLKLADYIDGGHEQRIRNAKWHISYFTDDDKKRIKSVAKQLNLKRYKLYPDIDSCIEEFRS